MRLALITILVALACTAQAETLFPMVDVESNCTAAQDRSVREEPTVLPASNALTT